MKKILGISAFYHDSAAAITFDENIIAAAQEERFTRIKHDSKFPFEAIKYCLNQSSCKLNELDYIVFLKSLFKIREIIRNLFGFCS